MSCSPCGFSYTSAPQILMTGQHPSLPYPAAPPSSSSMPPESLLPYDGRLLGSYPRLTDLYPGYPEHVAYTHHPAMHLYPAAMTSPYDMKDPRAAWGALPETAGYNQILAAYSPYGDRFDPVDSEARRRNATRETTSTLKAWLNEHRKNPYPTKGEKIMLAIITKMTLTQVSTWFANARRRLKKENKMTWEPRNKMDADDVKDYDDDDDVEDDGDAKKTRVDSDSRTTRCDSEEEGDRRGCEDSIEDAGHYSSTTQIAGRPYQLLPHHREKLPSNTGQPLENGVRAPSLIPTSEFTPTDSSSSPNLPDIQALMRSSPMDHHKDNRHMDSAKNSNNSSSAEDDTDMAGRNKPKIWSLADTATSKSPAPMVAGTPQESSGGMLDMLGHCGWFSVNPYHQVTNPSSSLGSFGGYHSHSGAAFASPTSGHGGSCSSVQGFVPPQTDTPPQTPPNMKVSSTLGTTGYLGGQGGHLYQSTGLNIQASKSNGAYPLSSHTRSYRQETAPEDYSATTGHFRSTNLQ